MATIILGAELISRKTSTILVDVDWTDSTSGTIACGDTGVLCTLPRGASIVGITAYAIEAFTTGGTNGVDLTIGVSGDMDSIFLTASAELEAAGPVAGVLGVDALEIVSETANTQILFGIIDSDGTAGTDALTAGTVRLAITIAESMN